jgi:hypothetical protein
MISEKVAVIKGRKASTLSKQIFDLTPFGSLPTQNNFEDNDIRKGSSNKRIKSLHFVKTNI